MEGRILFIAYDYYEYARAIDGEFREMGFESNFYSIQPETIPFKVARRLSGSLYRSSLDRYHSEIIEKYLKGYFDYVIFLQVHQMSQENMHLLKERQSQARFVLYNWDAVKTHDYRPYMRFFDRVLTFDPVDAGVLGVEYLPLFCIRRFQDLRPRFETPLSVYFIGSIVNPKRYEAVRAFERYCAANAISFQTYMSSTVHGITQMLKAGIWPRGVSLRAIGAERFVEMMETSNAVFDFANHAQSGFTMRTMENLCAGKKIITNNAMVKETDFYSEDRFFVFKGLEFEGVSEFLQRQVSSEGRDTSRYTVQEFARRLLGVAR
jgi:hypothetical protein